MIGLRIAPECERIALIKIQTVVVRIAGVTPDIVVTRCVAGLIATFIISSGGSESVIEGTWRCVSLMLLIESM